MPANEKKILKLDLHTHLNEASVIADPTIDLAWEIIKRVKEAGLDGLACTEHRDFEYGIKLQAIIHTYFDDEIIFIVGQEVDTKGHQFVELYLSNGKTFRFFAHPGHPSYHTVIGEHVHGIEIENAMHDWHIRRQEVLQIAADHELLLLKTSDAHYMAKIGIKYTEIALEDLYERSEVLPPTT